MNADVLSERVGALVVARREIHAAERRVAELEGQLTAAKERLRLLSEQARREAELLDDAVWREARA